MTAKAKSVLAYLAFRDGERCIPSISTMEADIGWSRNTVKSALAELKAEGLIRREERYRNNTRLTNEYFLDYDDERMPEHARREVAADQGVTRRVARTATGRRSLREDEPRLTQSGSTSHPLGGHELTHPGACSEPRLGQDLATEQEEELQGTRDIELVGNGKAIAPIPDDRPSSDWWVNGPFIESEPALWDELSQLQHAYDELRGILGTTEAERFATMLVPLCPSDMREAEVLLRARARQAQGGHVGRPKG